MALYQQFTRTFSGFIIGTQRPSAIGALLERAESLKMGELLTIPS